MTTFDVVSQTSPESDVFDRQKRIDHWNQDRLRDARVMVVGTGAIGNEVIKNLALLGFGYLFLVDFDDVEPSNLSRTVLFRENDVGRHKVEVAAERARELALAPTFRLDAFHGDVVWDLGTGVFREMDLVLGCLDNLEARIAVNRQCRLAGRPWIDSGIRQLAGHVATYRPDGAACYQCTLSGRQMMESRQRYSCDDFRRRESAAGRTPTTQVAAALAAALQVQEAVKLLCHPESVTDALLHFEGVRNELLHLSLTPRDECLAHVAYPDPRPLDLSIRDPLRRLLQEVSRDDRSGPGATLDLSSDRGFVVGLGCRGCGKPVELMAPPFRLDESAGWCPDCRDLDELPEASLPAGEPAAKKVISTYSMESTPEPILDLTLHRIGVPYLATLSVRDVSGMTTYYELRGDLPHLLPGLAARGTEVGHGTAPPRRSA